MGLREFFNRWRKQPAPEPEPEPDTRRVTVVLDRQETFDAIATCAATRLNVADQHRQRSCNVKLVISNGRLTHANVVFDIDDAPPKPRARHLRVVPQDPPGAR